MSEAARLLHIPALNIRRWIGGYSFKNENSSYKAQMPPLWRLQHPKYENHLELGFKDLIELKFVKEFLGHGLTMRTIRTCLEQASKEIDDSHPFTTRRFESDGKTIFLKSLGKQGETKLLDLKRKQFAFEKIIEQSFKDLDIKAGSVSSWRPFNGKASIVVDPARSFGQPIAVDYGIPTITLSQTAESEGSISAASRWYDVPLHVVRDAVAFEKSLLAA